MKYSQTTTAKLQQGDVVLMGNQVDGTYEATILSISKNAAMPNLFEITLTNRDGKSFPIRWGARIPQLLKVTN